MVRARFVLFIIPVLLLASAIIAQEPKGLLGIDLANAEIADGALPSEVQTSYTGIGASFNVDLVGEFANGSSWSNSTTSLAEDLTPGTSFSVTNGSATVEWTAYVLISPPYNISSVNLTLTNIPTSWSLSDVLDSSSVSRYPSAGIDAASGEVNVSSSVIDVFGIWTFTFTDSNGATNLECGINAGGYATTRSYEVGDSASFRGTAPVTSGSRMRFYLTDPLGITRYAADQTQAGSYFEWTSISIQSSWPAGVWYADVEFNNTGGASPTFVGRYRRSFNVTHFTSLSLRSPGDAVGDLLSTKSMGDLLYVSVDMTDIDNSEPVPGATVTLNWTDYGTPVIHTMHDHGNGTYGIALNTTDLDAAGRWHIDIDATHDFYTAPPTLALDLDLYDPTELTYKSVYSTPVGSDFAATLVFRDTFTGTPLTGASIVYANGTAVNVVNEANGEYNITVPSTSLALGEHWYIFNATKPGSYVNMASVNVTFLLRTHLTAATVSGNLTIPFGFNTSLSVVLVDLDTGLSAGIGDVSSFSFTSSYGTQDYASPTSFDLTLGTESWNVEQVSVTLSILMSSSVYSAPLDYTFNITVRPHFTLININGNLTKPYGQDTPLTVILLDMDTGENLGIGNVDSFILSSSYGTQFFTSPPSFDITLNTNTWSIGATSVTITATLSSGDYLQPSSYVFDIVMKPHSTAVSVGGDLLVPIGSNANVTVILIDLDLNVEVPIAYVASLSFTSSYGTEAFNNPSIYDVMLPTNTWAEGLISVNLSVAFSSSIYAAPANFEFDIQIRAHYTSLSVNGTLTTPYGLDTPLHVVFLDLDTGAPIDIDGVSIIRFDSVYETQDISSPSNNNVTLNTGSWSVGKVLVTFTVIGIPSDYEYPDAFIFEVTIRAHFTSASISANLTHAYGGNLPVSIRLVDVDTGLQIPIGDVGSFTFSSSYGTQILSSPASFDTLLDCDTWLVGTTPVNLSAILSNSIYYDPANFTFSVVIRSHYTSAAISGNLTIPYGFNTSLTVVLTDLDTGLAVDIGEVATITFASTYGTDDYSSLSSFDITLETDSWSVGTTNVNLSISMATTIFSNPSNYTFEITVRMRRTAVYVHGELITPYGMDTNISVALLDMDSGVEIDINDVDTFSFTSVYGTEPFSAPTRYDVTLSTDSWSVGLVTVTLSISLSATYYSTPTDYVFEVRIRSHITSTWVVGELTTPSGKNTSVTVFVKDLDTEAFVAISDVTSISFTSSYGTDVHSTPSSYTINLPTSTWTIGSWDVNLSISLSSTTLDDPENHSFIVIIRHHLTSVTVQGNLTTPYGLDTSIRVVLTDLDTGLLIDVSNVALFNFSSSYAPQVFNSPGSYDVLLQTDAWTVDATSVTLNVSLSGSIYDDPLGYVFDVVIRPHFTAASVLRDLQIPHGTDTDLTIIIIDLDLGAQIDIGSVSLIEFTSSYPVQQFSSPSSQNITLDTDGWDLGTEVVTMTITMAGTIYSAPNDYVFDIYIRKHLTSVSVSGNLTIPFGVDTQLTVVLTDLDTMSSIPIGDVLGFNFSSIYGLQEISPTGYDVTLDTNVWTVGSYAVILDLNMQTSSVYSDPENFTFSIHVRRHFTAASVSGELVVPHGNNSDLTILVLDLDTGMAFAISNVSSFDFDSAYGTQTISSPSSYDVTLTTNSWSVGVTEVTLSVLLSSSILNVPDDLVFNVTIRAHYTSINVKGGMTTLYGFDTPLTVEVTDLDTGLSVDIADIFEFNFTSAYDSQSFTSPSSYDVILDTDSWNVGTVSISLAVTISGSIHYNPATYSFDLNITAHQTIVSVSGDFTVPYGEDVLLTVFLIDSDMGIPVDISDVGWIDFTSIQGNQNETTPTGFSVTLTTSSWPLGTTLVTVSVGLSSTVYESPDSYEFNVTIRMHYTAVSVSGNLDTPRGENTPLDVVLIDLDTGHEVPIGAVDSFAFTSEYGTEPFASPASYGLQLTTDTWVVGSRNVNLSVSLAGSIYEGPSDFSFDIAIRLRYTSATVSGTLVVPYAFDTNLTVTILDLDSGSIVDEVNVDSLTFDSIYGAQGFTTYNLTLGTSGWTIGLTTVTLAVSLAGSDYANPANHTFTLEIRPHMTAVSVKGVFIQPYGNQTPLSVVLVNLDTMNPIAIASITSFTFDSVYGPQDFVSPSSYDVVLATDSWLVGVTQVTLSVLFSSSTLDAPDDFVFNVTIRAHYTSINVKGSMTTLHGFDTPLTVDVTDLDTGLSVDIADISEFNFNSIHGPQVFSSLSSYDVTLDTDTWDVGVVSISLTVAIGGSIYYDPSAYSFDLNIITHRTTVSVSGDFTVPYGEDVSLAVLLIDSDIDMPVDISDVAWINFTSIHENQNETALGSFDITLGTSSWSLGTTQVTVTVGLSSDVYEWPNSYAFNVTIRMHYTSVSISGDLETPRGENTSVNVVLIDLDTGLGIPIGAVDDFSFISGYGTESFSSLVSYGLQLTTDAWVVGKSQVNLSVSLAGSIYENPPDFTFNITVRLRYTSATVSGTLDVPYAFDTNLTVIVLDLDSGSLVDEINVASIAFDSTYGSQVFATYNLTLGTSAWDVGPTEVTLAVSLTGFDYADPANYTFTIEIRSHMTAVSVKGVVIQPYGNQTPLSVVLVDLDTMNQIPISNIASFTFDSAYGTQNFASPLFYDVVLATDSWLVGVTEVTLSVLFSSSTLDTPDDSVFNVTIRAHYTSINVKGSMTTLHGFDTPLIVEVIDLDTGLLVNIADIFEFNFTSAYSSQAFSSPSSYDVTLDTDTWDIGTVSISLTVAISSSIYHDPSAYSFDLNITMHHTSLSVSGDFTTPSGEDVSLIVLLIDSDLGISLDISDVAWINFTSIQGDQNEPAPTGFAVTLTTSSWPIGITPVTVSVGFSNTVYESPNSYEFNITIRMHYTAVSVSGDLVTPRAENTLLDVVLIDLDTGLAVPIGAVNSLAFTSEYGTEPFASPASYDLQLTTDTWGVGSKQVNLSASLAGSIYENPSDFTFDITIRFRFTSATVSGNLVVPYAFDTNLTVIVLDLDSGSIVDEINVDSLTFDSVYGAQGFTTYNLTLATSSWNIGPTTVTLAVSLASSDYADPANHTFTLEIRPHMTAVSVMGVVIQPYGNQTSLSVVLTDLDIMNPIDITNVASFTFDSSYGPQSMPSPSNYNVTLDTSLWSVGTTSVTLSVAIATSYYSIPESHVFQVTIRSLRIQLYHEPSDLIFPNGDDFRLVLGVKVTEPGPFYNDNLTGLLQSEFTVSGYVISITEVQPGRYRLIIDESYFTQGNYTIEIVIDPSDSRYSTDLLAVYFMYTPARSFLSSPNYPQVTTPYGADVNITLEYTDVDRGVGITGATMTPEGISITFSEHPTIQGTYIVTLIVTGLDTGFYSFNITASAADYESKMLSFTLLVRVVYTYAIPTVAALDIPVGNSPVFYVEYWDVDHGTSVSNETPFQVTGTWSSFTVTYEPGAPRPRYKITFITFDDTPLEQNLVVAFNFSKGVNYQAGVFTVTVTIRTHNTDFRLVSAVEPTSYKALLNISVYYGDLDNLAGIQDSRVVHYVEGDSGILASTLYNDTSPGYYIVQINATEFGGLGLQSLTIYFNWTGTVQKYHNLTLLVSANIIGAESSYTLLSASEPTPYLDNMSYVFLYKDLYTGQGITNISYGGGNVHIYVLFQEVAVDTSQLSIWEVNPSLYPGRYSVEFNTTVFGLVGALHMVVYVNWTSGAEPYYTNRTDIITVRILPRDTLVSVIPPSPTPYGENATFSFTFEDVTGGLSESIRNASNMIVTLGIPDFTIAYNPLTRIFSVSFNTSQLVTDSVGQVPFTLDVEWFGEPFYANRTGRTVFISIIQRLTILEYTPPPPSPFNDVVTFTVTWTDVTGTPKGVSGATLVLYDGSSGPEISASFYSWIDLNDGRYQISLNTSYAGMLGVHDLNVTLTTSLFYLANRTGTQSFVVGPRTTFLSSEPVGRIAYNTSIEIILYYQDLLNLDMIGNSTNDVSIEILNGSTWFFVSSWESFNEYYLITVQTSNHPELLVGTAYVLWFNMSYADSPPYYEPADTFVRIQFRNRASTIELNEAPQPTPYLDSINFTILYRDVDVYGEIQGASITVRKSGVPLVFGTDYTVTSLSGGLYLLSIDTESLDGIGPTPISVYANWSQTAPFYANATLNIVLTTILRYTNLEIVAPPSQTRFLDLVDFTISVIDLGTGGTISVPLSYFKLYNGSSMELLAPQFSIQDIGSNQYEITINSTVLSSRLVTNHELIVSVVFPEMTPFHRSDNTTARVSTTNRIGSVTVGQVLSTPLGDNMQLGFSFLDESSGMGIENAIILFDCLNVSLVQGTDFWISGNQGNYIVSVDTDALGDVGTYRFSLSVQWDPGRQPYYLNTTTLTLTGSVRLTDTLLTSGAPDPYTVPYTDNVTIVVTFTDLDHAEGIDGAGAGITINYTATGDIPAVWDYEALGQGKYRIVINTTDAGNPGIKTMQISIESYPYRAAWVQISFQVRLRSGVLSAVVPDAYAGETVSVHVNLTDSDANDAPLDGALLDIDWEDSYTLNALGGGIYEVNLSTTILDWGYHTLYINATATDFKISPLAIDVYLDPLLTKVIPKAIEPVRWGDSVIISAVFNDTINGVFIEGATLVFTWAGVDYTMTEMTPGNYTAELNTSVVAASTYYIVIRANKTNYVSSNAQITLVVDFLDIQVTLVNGIFGTVSRGDEVNMTIHVFDPYNSQPLLGANVTVYWTFNESKSAPLVELGNGYYQYYVDTDDSESAESYQVIVTALKANYRAMSEVLTLGIKQTETAVWFDAVSQTYEDLIFNWSQVIRIGVYVVAPELNITNPDYYLENCTVTWKSGSYSGNLTFDGTKFYFDFNTTEYPAQTYSFRVTAVPLDLAFSLSGNGTIIIVQTIQTELRQPENVNQRWGWTGWFNFTYWDVYHNAGIDNISYGRAVYASYSWPGGSGAPFYFGNGVYGIFIDTSQSVPRSDPYTIVIEFQLDNFVPQLGRFNLIISPIPAEITASAPAVNQIDNSTINLRVPWGDTITVGLRYATLGVNTTDTPYVGGIEGATIDSATFRAPDFPSGYREDFILLEMGGGNYSFTFDSSLWQVSRVPYQFSISLSYGNRTDFSIAIYITVIEVPTSITVVGSSSYAVEHLASQTFTVQYIDIWPGHNGAGIEGAFSNKSATDDTIGIVITEMGAGVYQVTISGDTINEEGGFFNITLSKGNYLLQTTIDISYRILPNENDILIGNLRNYGLPFGALILIFAVIYNRVLKLPKRVRQMRKMISALGKGKVPKPVDDVLSRREMVANLFNDTMKDLEITTSPESVPEFSIIVDVPEMGELLIQLAILTRLSAEELEDFRRDISKMRVSEQAAFVKEVIYQEALRVARLEHRRYEEVLEDVVSQARQRLVGEDIIAVSEIDTSAADAEPLVLTEDKAKIEFDEIRTKVEEPTEARKDEAPSDVREYMHAYEIEELRSQLEARGLPREEISVIIEQVRTLPRELVDDLIKSLIGDKKEG